MSLSYNDLLLDALQNKFLSHVHGTHSAIFLTVCDFLHGYTINFYNVFKYWLPSQIVLLRLSRRVNSASQPLEETASKSELSAQPISNEDMERKVKGLLEELYNSGDLNEAMTCLKELGSAQADPVGVVDTIISVSLERKGTNWEMLHKLLKTSAEAGSVEAITKTALHKGCRRVLDKLADTAVDVPLAPQQVADCLAALIDVELLELKKISEEILIADLEDVPSEEDTMLVGDGYAIKVLDRMLAELATKWGEEKLKEAWLATGLDACKFLPSDDRSEDNLPTSLAKLIK